MNSAPRHIIISRTDSIGDVVLTLPLAFALKNSFPGVRITFMGKPYTQPVIEACSAVDVFLNVADFLQDGFCTNADYILHVFPVKEIARRAKELHIPHRVGTRSRLYHWLTCNHLLNIHRKKSPLHEAQLNLKFLQAFDITNDFSLKALKQELYLDNTPMLQREFIQLFQPGKKYIVLHPKSSGSAREWPLQRWIELIELMYKQGDIQIFISGTASERDALRQLLEAFSGRVVDIAGLMPLSQFIAFINHCDALIAASTGPLHIAAALGKTAVGLYPVQRPMHAGRWGPLGKKAIALSAAAYCGKCAQSTADCTCLERISAGQVMAALEKSPQ